LHLRHGWKPRSRRKRKLEEVPSASANEAANVRISALGSDAADLLFKNHFEMHDLTSESTNQTSPREMDAGRRRTSASPTSVGIKPSKVLTPAAATPFNLDTTEASRAASSLETEEVPSMDLPSRWGDDALGLHLHSRNRDNFFSRGIRERAVEPKKSKVTVPRPRVIASSSMSSGVTKMNKRTAERLNRRNPKMNTNSRKINRKTTSEHNSEISGGVNLVNITETLNHWTATKKKSKTKPQFSRKCDRAMGWPVEHAHTNQPLPNEEHSLGDPGCNVSSYNISQHNSDSDIESDAEETSVNIKESPLRVVRYQEKKSSDRGGESYALKSSSSAGALPGCIKSDASLKSDRVSRNHEEGMFSHGVSTSFPERFNLKGSGKPSSKFSPPMPPDAHHSNNSPVHVRRNTTGKKDMHSLSAKYKDSRRRTLQKHRILQHKQDMAFCKTSRKKMVDSIPGDKTVCEVIFHQSGEIPFSTGSNHHLHDVSLCRCAAIRQTSAGDGLLDWVLALVWAKNLQFSGETGSRFVLHHPFFEISSLQLPCKGIIALTGQSLVSNHPSPSYASNPPQNTATDVENVINLIKSKGLANALNCFCHETASGTVASLDKSAPGGLTSSTMIAKYGMELFRGTLSRLAFEAQLRLNVVAKLIRFYLHPSLIEYHLRSKYADKSLKPVDFSLPMPFFEDGCSGVLLVQLAHSKEIAKIIIRGDVERCINLFVSTPREILLFCGLQFLRLDRIDALTSNVIQQISGSGGISVCDSRRLKKMECAVFSIDASKMHVQRVSESVLVTKHTSQRDECLHKDPAIIVSSCLSLWFCTPFCPRKQVTDSSSHHFTYRRVTMLVSCQRWIKLQEFHRFCADEVECQSREEYSSHDVGIATSTDYACAYETKSKTRGSAPFHPYVQGYVFVSDMSLMAGSEPKSATPNIFAYPLPIAVMSSHLIDQVELLCTSALSTTKNPPLLMLHDVLVKQRQSFRDESAQGDGVSKGNKRKTSLPLLFADSFTSISNVNAIMANPVKSCTKTIVEGGSGWYGPDVLVPAEVLFSGSTRSLEIILFEVLFILF
jgi:hypothetical protein